MNRMVTAAGLLMSFFLASSSSANSEELVRGEFVLILTRAGHQIAARSSIKSHDAGTGVFFVPTCTVINYQGSNRSVPVKTVGKEFELKPFYDLAGATLTYRLAPPFDDYDIVFNQGHGGAIGLPWDYEIQGLLVKDGRPVPKTGVHASMSLDKLAPGGRALINVDLPHGTNELLRVQCEVIRTK